MKSSIQESWSAYLDSELSVSEAETLNESFTPAERSRLEREFRLEAAIGGALDSEVQCPDELWQRLRNRLEAQGARSKRILNFRPRRVLWWAGAAAACLCVLLVWHRVHTTAVAKSEFLRTPASVSELAAAVQVPGDHQQVQTFLAAHGIGLLLRPISEIELPPGHTAVLLGARTNRYGGAEVVELLYECCGEPVKLVIARHGSTPGRHIARAGQQGRIQAGRRVADYEIGIVSDHKAKSLLDIFAGAT